MCTQVRVKNRTIRPPLIFCLLEPKKGYHAIARSDPKRQPPPNLSFYELNSSGSIKSQEEPSSKPFRSLIQARLGLGMPNHNRVVIAALKVEKHSYFGNIMNLKQAWLTYVNNRKIEKKLNKKIRSILGSNLPIIGLPIRSNAGWIWNPNPSQPESS